MPENQTACNSDNQRIKETVRQTSVPRQRNMAHMKQHSKTPGKELSDEEIANLS